MIHEEGLDNLLDRANNAEFLDRELIVAINKSVHEFLECLEQEKITAQRAISSIKIPRVNLGILKCS